MQMYIYSYKLTSIIINYYKSLIKDKNAIINVEYFHNNPAMFAHISIETSKKLKSIKSDFYLNKYELNLIINSHTQEEGYISTGFESNIFEGEFIGVIANITMTENKRKILRRK